MKNWVILTFLYATFMGFFQCAKKKSVEKNSIYEVLAWFSLISFILAAFTSKNVFDIDVMSLTIIFIKSLVIVIAWLISLNALSKMPVSLYSVINLSRIIFSIILSAIILGEQITLSVIIGMIIVVVGLILVNISSKKDEKEDKEASLKLIVIVLFSCLLNSISGILDKKVMLRITSSQLQFWFLLFLTIMYWLILIIKKRKINFNAIKNNYWIPITAICLTVGDRFLFIANEIPESKVSVMTLIKRFSTIELIILGKIFFNDKKIMKKLLCSILIILGILITLIK